MTDAIYTIGHSTHSILKLIELLRGQSITALCDVRSKPYSRLNPQFNREQLKEALQSAGIKYVFLGRELGARPIDKTCFQNGRVRYDLLAKTDLFKRGIERVKKGMGSYRVALMCAEKEPLHCHRTILISRKLFEDGVPIKHILSDGDCEEHAHAIDRLIAELGIPENDMFRPRDEVIREAYARQAEEIAYREETSSALVSS
jgi:uncharacterized protein (DUF488 family)